MKKAQTVKEKWLVLQDHDRRNSGERGLDPEHFIKLLRSHNITIEEATELLNCVDPQKSSQLMWRSEFMTERGVSWLFAHLKFLNTKINNPIYQSTEGDRQLRSKLIATLYSLRAYREKLVQYDHMIVLMSVIGEVSVPQDEIIKILLMIASLCSHPEAATKVVDAIRYFIFVDNLAFKRFVEELKRPTGTLQFKVAFMTLLNATLVATTNARLKDLLSNDYLENGVTYTTLADLLVMCETNSDDAVVRQIRKHINEYVDQANLSGNSKPKCTKSILCLYTIVFRYSPFLFSNS